MEMNDPRAPHFVVTAPPSLAGLVLSLTEAELVVGHSDTADLVLEDDYVSRRQALVTIDAAGNVTVSDLNSASGTFVNEERLEGPCVLQAGDVVRFAEVEARFEPGARQGDEETAEPEDAAGVDLSKTAVLPSAAAPPPPRPPPPPPAPAAPDGGDWDSVRPGLVMGTSGSEVGALHDALVVIGLQIDVAERESQTFSASTVAAVIKLQALAGIEQTGAVDENTTAVISLALDRLGIQPGDTGFTARQAPYSVSGTVRDQDGMPMAKAFVLAFDCELRSTNQLNDTPATTDASGAYRIAYDQSKLAAGKTAADLKVEVTDSAGGTLATSPILFSAPRQATIDVAIGGAAHAQPSEFSAIETTATPLLGKLSPVELEQSGQQQDLELHRRPDRHRARARGVLVDLGSPGGEDRSAGGAVLRPPAQRRPGGRPCRGSRRFRERRRPRCQRRRAAQLDPPDLSRGDRCRGRLRGAVEHRAGLLREPCHGRSGAAGDPRESGDADLAARIRQGFVRERPRRRVGGSRAAADVHAALHGRRRPRPPDVLERPEEEHVLHGRGGRDAAVRRPRRTAHAGPPSVDPGAGRAAIVGTDQGSHATWPA